MTTYRLAWGLVLAVLLVIISVHASVVFAQDVVVTPESAVVAPEGADIRIPWGAWLSELSSAIGTLLFAIVVWGLRRLPSNIVNLLQTLRAEQLLQRAIDYGVNATAGATKDRVLSINVGNEVLQKALKYAVANGAPKLVEWLGGPEGLSSKIVARLELPPDAKVVDAPDSIAVVAPATAAMPPIGPGGATKL